MRHSTSSGGEGVGHIMDDRLSYVGRNIVGAVVCASNDILVILANQEVEKIELWIHGKLKIVLKVDQIL